MLGGSSSVTTVRSPAGGSVGGVSRSTVRVSIAPGTVAAPPVPAVAPVPTVIPSAVVPSVLVRDGMHSSARGARGRGKGRITSGPSSVMNRKIVTQTDEEEFSGPRPTLAQQFAQSRPPISYTEATEASSSASTLASANQHNVAAASSSTASVLPPVVSLVSPPPPPPPGPRAPRPVLSGPRIAKKRRTSTARKRQLQKNRTKKQVDDPATGGQGEEDEPQQDDDVEKRERDLKMRLLEANRILESLPDDTDAYAEDLAAQVAALTAQLATRQAEDAEDDPDADVDIGDIGDDPSTTAAFVACTSSLKEIESGANRMDTDDVDIDDDDEEGDEDEDGNDDDEVVDKDIIEEAVVVLIPLQPTLPTESTIAGSEPPVSPPSSVVDASHHEHFFTTLSPTLLVFPPSPSPAVISSIEDPITIEAAVPVLSLPLSPQLLDAAPPAAFLPSLLPCFVQAESSVSLVNDDSVAVVKPMEETVDVAEIVALVDSVEMNANTEVEVEPEPEVEPAPAPETVVDTGVDSVETVQVTVAPMQVEPMEEDVVVVAVEGQVA